MVSSPQTVIQLLIIDLYISLLLENIMVELAWKTLTEVSIHGQEPDYETLYFKIKICTMLLPSILQTSDTEISRNELYNKSIQELKHDVFWTLHFMSCVLFGRAVAQCIQELQPK
jgi:hypothetical protein